jgi:hypothetical protein
VLVLNRRAVLFAASVLACSSLPAQVWTKRQLGCTYEDGVTSATCSLGANPSVGDYLAVASYTYSGGPCPSETVQDAGGNSYVITTASPFDAYGNYAVLLGCVSLYYWVATGTPNATVTASCPSCESVTIWVDDFECSGTCQAPPENTSGAYVGATIDGPTLIVTGTDLLYSICVPDSYISSVNLPWIVGGSQPNLSGGTDSGDGAGYSLNVTSDTAVNMTGADSYNHWECVGMAFYGAAAPSPSPGGDKRQKLRKLDEEALRK